MEMDKEQKIKEAKNAYHRQWRRKNPEKAKAYVDSYWLRQYEARQSECNKA
jgi:hypothetical protein